MESVSFRTLLNGRLNQILARNERVNARLRQVSGIPDDWGERAVLLEDDAVLEGLDTEARAEIAAIRTALGRIDDGTYGSCARCGADVGEARLRALPFAITCVTCAAG